MSFPVNSLPNETLTSIQPKRSAHSDFQQVLEAALRLLARREHSSVELRRKLDARGGSQAVINRVLEALRIDGSLSDERFTTEFVRSRIRKGYGPIRIRMDLIERGIADRMAEDELTQPADFWQSKAIEACRKKFGCLVSPQVSEPIEDDETARMREQQLWNRRARFLSQRGFPADLIYRTLDGRLAD